MDYNAQYQAYLNTAETALAQQADRCFNERSRVCEAARYSLFCLLYTSPSPRDCS